MDGAGDGIYEAAGLGSNLTETRRLVRMCR